MMDSESILLIGMVVGLFGSLMMLAGDLLQHLSTEKLEINTASQAYCIVMRELPESHDDFFDTHFSSTLCTVAALPYAAAFATLPLAQAVRQALSFYLLQQFCWLSRSFTVLLIIPTFPINRLLQK